MKSPFTPVSSPPAKWQTTSVQAEGDEPEANAVSDLGKACVFLRSLTNKTPAEYITQRALDELLECLLSGNDRHGLDLHLAAFLRRF